MQRDRGLCTTLSSKFHIPKFFWTDTAYEANGFYGSQDDPIPESAGHSHCKSVPTLTYWRDGVKRTGFFSRFLIKEIHPELPPTEAYEWQYLAFCSLWYCGEQEDSLGVHVLLCFDVSQRIQGAISTGFRATQGADLRNSPFSLQIELAEIVVAQYDKALWTFRKPIRNIEKVRFVGRVSN